jgi:MFS family permease
LARYWAGFFGHLSDRLGRIRVLTFTILMFSVFTGLCAVAQGYWDLLAYRTLAGMGLGGEFGIGMALIAEVWPASKRNRASAWVGIGWQLGVLLAAFITLSCWISSAGAGCSWLGCCPRWSHLPSAAAWGA